MTRYAFEFVSAYDGQSDYRVWRDGRDDGRICVRKGAVTYCDGSALLRVDLDAFNTWQKERHDLALSRYPDIGPFLPCTTG